MSHAARMRVAALLLIALPAAASAQAGGLINRAKQAVADKAAKPAGTDDHIGEPFDAASLNNALAGMRAYKARMNQVAAIQAQYLDNQKKRTALQESSEKTTAAYEESSAKNRNCRTDYLADARANRGDPMQKKMQSLMNDPAALQKFAMESSRLNQVIMAAQAKGDTNAVKAATRDLQKLGGVDEAADSVAADKKCGAPPPRPAATAQLDQMQQRSDDLNRQLRTAETASDTDGAQAAGVSATRFAQMKERLTQFVNNGPAFGGKEGDLLKAHKTEIERLVKTP
jgi:hypothetical protein